MGHIIATVNMKGGVGKTTLSVNLATCLAKNHGKRVLVLDLDSQVSATLCMLSTSEFTNLKHEKRTLSSLLNQVINEEGITTNFIKSLVQQNVCNVQGLDLIAGDFELYDEFMVSEYLCFEFINKELDDFEELWNRFEDTLVYGILNPLVKEYDFIILDCAPGYNLLTRSSIIASDFYLLPNQPEPLSWLGTQLLDQRIKKLKEKHQSTINLIGIVFRRPANPSQATEKSKHKFTEGFGKEKIFNTEIPTSYVVAEAAEKNQPVVLTEPKHPASQAFATLTEEFLHKLSQSLAPS